MKCFFMLMIALFCITIANGQNTWVKTGNLTYKVSSMVVDDTGNIFAGTEYGIYRSTDKGNTWISYNNGFKTSMSIKLLVLNPKTKSIIAAVSGDGLYKLTDKNTSWKKLNMSENDKIVVDYEGNIFIGYYYSGTYDSGYGIIRSIDDGENWVYFLQNNDRFLSAMYVNLFVDNLNQIIMIEHHKYWDSYRWSISMSADKGITWESLNNEKGPEFTSMASNSFRHMFYGDIQGTLNRTNDYFKTNSGQKRFPKQINSIVIEKDDKIFVGVQNLGVYYSSDGNLASFKEFNNGLTNLNVNCIIIDSSNVQNHFLYAGTDYGVFKTINPILAVAEITNISKFDVNIKPNPATDIISISFNNSEFSNSSISIFNSIGVELKKFAEKEMNGQSSISFSTEEIQSGIYSCTLTSGTKRVTKSFVVVR